MQGNATTEAETEGKKKPDRKARTEAEREPEQKAETDAETNAAKEKENYNFEGGRTHCGVQSELYVIWHDLYQGPTK